MRIILLLFVGSFLTACGSTAKPVAQNSNAADRPMRSEQMQNSIAHTTENQPAIGANGNSAKMSSGGEAIDTAKFDGVISEAEKAVKAKPEDAAAKATLAQAYFDRAFALSQPPARQYAAAIGDYRRALKYDPNHEESRKWVAQIEGIYKSLKKEAPIEGEEPAALPFKKG